MTNTQPKHVPLTESISTKPVYFDMGIRTELPLPTKIKDLGAPYPAAVYMQVGEEPTLLGNLNGQTITLNNADVITIFNNESVVHRSGYFIMEAAGKYVPVGNGVITRGEASYSLNKDLSPFNEFAYVPTTQPSLEYPIFNQGSTILIGNATPLHQTEGEYILETISAALDRELPDMTHEWEGTRLFTRADGSADLQIGSFLTLKNGFTKSVNVKTIKGKVSQIPLTGTKEPPTHAEFMQNIKGHEIKDKFKRIDESLSAVEFIPV